MDENTEDLPSIHRKIMHDWCKAYISQLYQENNGEIKPGDLVLNTQGTGDGYKYWFTKKDAE